MKIWYSNTGEKLDCKKDKPKSDSDIRVRCGDEMDPDVNEKYNDLPNTYF